MSTADQSPATETPPAAKARHSRPSTVVAGSAWGDDPAYTVAEAAVALGVTPKAMYDYIASRRIGHVRLGGTIRIRRSHIAAFIARGEVRAV